LGPSLAPYADTPRKVPREDNPKPRKVPVQEHVRRPPTVFQPAALFSARKRAAGSPCALADAHRVEKDRQCHSDPVLFPFPFQRGDLMAKGPCSQSVLEFFLPYLDSSPILQPPATMSLGL